jgi:hypothetical protein
MYKIDIHNYEAYLLDFSEGNLSEEDQMELELFLMQHPELELNLDELSFASLNKEIFFFSGKTDLKKSVADLVSADQFIAYIENQSTSEERLRVEKSCTLNSSLLKELALYKRTITSADESIIFENKISLKRKPKVIWFNFSLNQYAAAACILFLIGLFIFWQGIQEPTVSTVANNTMKEKTGALPSINSTGSRSQNTVNSVSLPEANTKNLAQLLPVNTSLKNDIRTDNKTSQTQNNEALKKDSLITPIHNPVTEPFKQDMLVAQNAMSPVKQQSVVQIISEDDDELLASNTPVKKKGIWAAASKALKNLNQVGVKSVDGDEETSKENTAYALTLGGVSITHKAGKL